MKQKVVAVIAALSFVVCVSAQVPTEKTLLWQVSGQGITKPSYLFGTIHLMCSADMVMPPVVKQKFDASKQLFLEIDLDDPEMMNDMMKGMQMQNNVTLESLIGNSFDSVSNIFQSKTGMSLKVLNSAKPFLLMSMIYPSILGCTPQSWETVFEKMAKEKNIEIKGLEKVQDQMDVFEKIPYKVQSDMLVKMLENLDSSKQSFNEMMEVYKNKDINKLHEMTVSDKDFGDYEKTLLIDRNHNWIPVIGEQAKKTPTFFAFGAGHLGGENGIIYLLRKAGYTVSPIYYK